MIAKTTPQPILSNKILPSASRAFSAQHRSPLTENTNQSRLHPGKRALVVTGEIHPIALVGENFLRARDDIRRRVEDLFDQGLEFLTGGRFDIHAAFFRLLLNRRVV